MVFLSFVCFVLYEKVIQSLAVFLSLVTSYCVKNFCLKSSINVQWVELIYLAAPCSDAMKNIACFELVGKQKPAF